MSDPVSTFEEALKAYLVEQEMLDDGELLTGWSMVVETADMHDDADGVVVCHAPGTTMIRRLGMHEYATAAIKGKIQVSIYEGIEDGDDE